MKRDTRRLLGIISVVSGAYVILAELPFWTTRSSLAPVLTALAVGLIALGLATAMGTRE